MAINPAVIGTRSEPFETIAEPGRLRNFAAATGQTDPIYLNTTAAKAAGHPDLPIPPTFLFCLEMDNPHRHAFLASLGVDMRTILHGEQRFEYHALAHAGDTLTFWNEVRDVYSKKGGALQFIIRDTHISRGDEPIATLTNTIVVRDPKAAP